MSKQVYKQLFKEFWIPLVLSILWVIYNILGSIQSQQLTIQQIVNVFGPTFFLISWLTGQFFRVKKQTKIENSFSNVENKMIGLVDKLDEKTEELIGNLTGGDSFPMIQMTSINGDINTGQLIAVNQGSYPLYDVTVQVANLTSLRKDSNDFTSAIWNHNTFIEIGNINPSQAVHLQKLQLLNDPDQSYNLFFIARNGSFIQQLRMRKINGKWLSATRVIKKNDTLYEKIDEHFPIHNNNNINWD